MAVFLVMVAIYMTAPTARSNTAGTVSDATVLALAQKHCTTCHAAKPTHESFQEAPKNVTLESIANLRRYAPLIMTQTVVNKAMPPRQPDPHDRCRARSARRMAGAQK